MNDPLALPAAAQDERQIMSGMLSKDSRFRLIVTGTIGAKEIGTLIKKLEFDKTIVTDPMICDGSMLMDADIDRAARAMFAEDEADRFATSHIAPQCWEDVGMVYQERWRARARSAWKALAQKDH